MKRATIFILILSSIILLAQTPWEEIKLQKSSLEDFKVNSDSVKIPPWKPLGPNGGSIQAMAFNPKKQREMYAAMEGYPALIFKSADSGKSWELLCSLYNSISDMSFDPKNPEIIYTHSAYGINKSEDRGKTWKYYRFESSPSPGDDLADISYYADEGFAIDPEDTNILYCAGYFHDGNSGKSGLACFKSTDGGETWTITGFTDSQTTAWSRGQDVALNPLNPSEIYLVGYLYMYPEWQIQIYRSKNKGESWTNIAGDLKKIDEQAYSIVLDPINPSNVYVCTSGGVYRSSNSGQSWTKNEGSVLSTTALAIDPNNPSTLYAGGNRSCYKSMDGGVNWSKYEQGLMGSCRVLLVPSKKSSKARAYAQSKKVYFGSSTGFYASSNGGLSWKASMTGINASLITAIASAPSLPKVVYAGVKEIGLYKSTKSGKKWQKMPDLYQGKSILKIAVNPNDSKEIYVLAGDYFYRSADGGETMSKIYDGDSLRSFTVSPNDFKIIYIAGEEWSGSKYIMTTFISKDGGQNWTKHKVTTKGGTCQAVAVDPKNNNIVYAGGYSTDTAAGHRIHALSGGELYKSLNGGKKWKKVGSGIEAESIIGIVIDPVSPSNVYVAADYDGVFKSTDSGNSFSKTNPRFNARCLWINPTNRKVIFAGGYGGAYYSTDSGQNWTEASEGLPVYHVIGFDWHSKKKVLLAGTEGGGVCMNKRILKMLK
jgi:photosystem II stability/assembly factor-like uncharacterized protein